MKIILSRKGFDSKNGGVASPIMPDGTLLSLPIPDKQDDIKYEELQYKGKSYAQIIAELTNDKFKEKKCHLDPDIRKDVFSRPDKWLPAFGQSRGRLTHLFNESVGENDLFLFFGWFREVEEINGKYQYVKGDKKDKHIIYGYLQVGKILDNPTKEQYPYLEKHPHLDRDSKDNTIFVARPTLSWDETKYGAGCLNLKNNPKLVLTKDNCSRSRWELPVFFREVKISHHPNSWKEHYFQSAGIGQEFVIASDGKGKTEKWAKDLINIGQQSTN